MGVYQCAISALLIVGLLTVQIWAQDEPAPEPPAEPPAPPAPPPGGQGEVELLGDDLINHNFISFETGIDDMDIFRFERYEFLLISDKRTARQAYLTCKQYNAILAPIITYRQAAFIADALSETRFVLDTLWVAGKQIMVNKTATNAWEWVTENGLENVTEEVAKHIIQEADLKVSADDRHCLGFGRLDHDKPQFRPLTCNARRNIICKRARGTDDKGNSTHPGWIKIGKRLYKIYADRVNYEAAEEKCTMLRDDAALAVVVSFADAQMLGRYLLIGRPSLENAWIGGRWKDSRYRFDIEALDLHNITDASISYPPWRNNKMQKPGGCLLLDRHLSNITLFVEARCFRERAIICYRFDKNGTNDNAIVDVIIGPFGYRLVVQPPLTWEEARNVCSIGYGKYNAKLVEIDEAVHKTNLLYVMGENKTAVQHIWLGGQHNDSKWRWVSTGKDVDDGMLNWVKNGSWEREVEEPNVCLNMDRENHVTALHYGTSCTAVQPYVCQFPADQLAKLQEDEMNNRFKRQETPAPP